MVCTAVRLATKLTTSPYTSITRARFANIGTQSWVPEDLLPPMETCYRVGIRDVLLGVGPRTIDSSL